MKIAVIGGGISGLSAAQFLGEKYAVTVFEKDNRPGGLIKCRRVNGSLFHTCGGHVFNSKRADVLEWFWSKLNRESDFVKADRNSVVYVDNKGMVDADGDSVIPYPIENHVYLFNKELQKKIIDDFVKIAKNEGAEPANFEEFLKNRFGATLYDIYFRPYNEKVWRKDLKNVPLSWLEGKLPMPTVAEMIFNNINHVKEKAFVHATFWYEKKDGSQHIIDTLSEGLNIKCDSKIDSIEKSGNGWLVNGERFDKVVFCGNIKDLPGILKGADLSEYTDRIAALEYHGTTAAFCEIDANPYSWIYQPSGRHESHRIICTGNFSPTNNSETLPKGRITATVEFADEISKEDILDNLKRMPLNPKYLDHQYNPYTYPVQNADTRKMIQTMKQHLAGDNFYFTGRFADWEYYNMDVAIGAAMDLCRSL